MHLATTNALDYDPDSFLSDYKHDFMTFLDKKTSFLLNKTIPSYNDLVNVFVSSVQHTTALSNFISPRSFLYTTAYCSYKSSRIL